MKPKVITAEVIHTDFIKEGINYINTLRSGSGSIIIPPSVQNKLMASNRGSLINIEEPKSERVRQFNIKAISFLSEALDVLGQDIILISYDKFLELLERYNLVCGECSDYIGEIPEKNLRDINHSLEVLANVRRDKNYIYYSAHFSPVTERVEVIEKKLESFESGFPVVGKFTEISLKYGVKQKSIKLLSEYAPMIARFPFSVKDTFLPEVFLYRPPFFDREGEHLFEAIFKEPGGRIEWKYCTGSPIFIAAPQKQMKHILEIKNDLMPEDPFAISLTRYGVLIHTMWGIESKDETVKTYRTLIYKLIEIKNKIKGVY